jgi:hypothetical protein
MNRAVAAPSSRILQIGKKGPTGLYKKWQQSTRGRIQGGGEDEESSVSLNCLIALLLAISFIPHLTTVVRLESLYREHTVEALSSLLVWMLSRYEAVARL